MLVLTRTKNQKIEITGSGPVRITVVGINSSRVRLGFEAPDGTTILRDNAVSRLPKCIDRPSDTA